MAVGYVPDGMSPEQYRKIREKEMTEKNAKNLGAYGPRASLRCEFIAQGGGIVRIGHRLVKEYLSLLPGGGRHKP